jgi:gas vesicle protein
MKERQDTVMQQLNEIMNVQEENQESINRQMEVRHDCFCPF